jgi:hypothetical protein
VSFAGTSIRVTTKQLNVIGLPTTSNIALISGLVAMACSISLRAFRRRLGMSQERLWPKGLCHLARMIFGLRTARELDCGGHSSNKRWDSRGALGCDSRRGHARVVQERPSHVRRQVWGLKVKYYAPMSQVGFTAVRSTVGTYVGNARFNARSICCNISLPARSGVGVPSMNS